ncbi:hypothetical protein J1N35_005872 [Gossypium stocksii]|uniref:Uncharacterized protein n=1 Tax=Gossypium stocksii TaxID=47602 RepID=A0A9D3WEQ3_9ROSI|nr:hypothetical protein J1N35_005872 [Gossypium stocksii]
MLEATSLSKAQIPLASSLSSSLQFLLSEANMVGFKYEDTCKRWGSYRILTVAENNMDGLACEVATKRQSKEVVKIELDRVVAKHAAQTEKSVALANCVGGYGFNLTSLNMTVRSFAFTNRVEGYIFNLTSLIMIVGSFALANCIRGCCFNPVSLGMIVGSFDFADYVGGYNFNPASLNMTAGNFAISNCVEGCDFNPASLSMIIGNFTLANCVRGCGFLSYDLYYDNLELYSC